LAPGAVVRVLALGTLEVRAPGGTRVYLGEELVGEAPLLLSRIPPGDHRVQIEDPTTGELRSFMFHAPASTDVIKVLEVDFPGPAAAVPSTPEVMAEAPRPLVACPPVETEVVVRGTSPLPVPGYPTAPYFPGNPRFGRAQVHTRNTLLGLLAANQLLNDHSRDRKRYRNVGLGLTVLNELLR
jgi:hypothetical protein